MSNFSIHKDQVPDSLSTLEERMERLGIVAASAEQIEEARLREAAAEEKKKRAKHRKAVKDILVWEKVRREFLEGALAARAQICYGTSSAMTREDLETEFRNIDDTIASGQLLNRYYARGPGLNSPSRSQRFNRRLDRESGDIIEDYTHAEVPEGLKLSPENRPKPAGRVIGMANPDPDNWAETLAEIELEIAGDNREI